jgi:hypothetical protein
MQEFLGQLSPEQKTPRLRMMEEILPLLMAGTPQSSVPNALQGGVPTPFGGMTSFSRQMSDVFRSPLGVSDEASRQLREALLAIQLRRMVLGGQLPQVPPRARGTETFDFQMRRNAPRVQP